MKKLFFKNHVLFAFLILLSKDVGAGLSSRAEEKFVPVGSRAAGALMGFTGSLGEHGAALVAPVTLPAAGGALIAGAPATAINVTSEVARQAKKAFDNRNETKDQRLDRKIMETEKAMKALEVRKANRANADEIVVDTSSNAYKARDEVGRKIEGLIDATKKMKGNLTVDQQEKISEIHQKLKNPEADYAGSHYRITPMGDFVGYSYAEKGRDLDKIQKLVPKSIDERKQAASEWQKAEEQKALSKGPAKQGEQPRIEEQEQNLRSSVAYDIVLKAAINAELAKQGETPKKSQGWLSSVMASIRKNLLSSKPKNSEKVPQELKDLYAERDEKAVVLAEKQNKLNQYNVDVEEFRKKSKEDGKTEYQIKSEISDRFGGDIHLRRDVSAANNDLIKSTDLINIKHKQIAEEDVENRIKEDPNFIKNMISEVTVSAKQGRRSVEEQDRQENTSSKPVVPPKPAQFSDTESKPPLPPKPVSFESKAKPSLPPKPVAQVLEEKGPWE